MKKNLFRAVWAINILVHIILFITLNIIYKNNYDTSSINYLTLTIIELLNIGFGILFFSKINKNIIYAMFIIFVVSTVFIPVYHTTRTYAPKGDKSELMGLAVEEKNLNIYCLNTVINWK